MGFIIRLLLSGLAVMVTAYLLPGVHVAGFMSAILVALLLGLLNAVLRPILVLFTIPITIFTLGLFLLVINVIMVYITAALIPGFDVDGFIPALLFSLILSLLMSVFHAFAPEN